MTAKKKTDEELRQEQVTAAQEKVWQRVSNKHKRTAIAHWDQPLEEFDVFDSAVFIAWVADNTNEDGTPKAGRTLDELDELPMKSLDDVILGEG